MKRKKVIAFIVSLSLLAMCMPQIAVYADTSDTPGLLVPVDEKEIITDKADSETGLTEDNEQNNAANPPGGNVTDGKTDISTEEEAENPPAGEELQNPDSSDESETGETEVAPENVPDSSDTDDSSESTDIVPPLNEDEILDADDGLIEDNSQSIYASNFSYNALNTDNLDSEENISDNSEISPDSLDTQNTDDTNNQDINYPGLVFNPVSGILTVTDNSGWDRGLTSFDSNNDVKEIKISDGVDLRSNLFSSFTNLTSVTIPDSVTSIDENVFKGCSSLKNICIGTNVTSIGKNAFSGCEALENITIPDSVTSISDNAFDGCSSLKNISIGTNVTSIGENAFSGCEALENITIPDSVTSISNNAFNGCSSLKNISIGTNVTSIGENAFNGCEALESITIPDSVTTISDNAFDGCLSLKNISIGTNVTSIGENAFNGCKALESITIPESVTSIGSGAFFDTSITNVAVRDGVSIDSGAFNADCKISRILVPYNSGVIDDTQYKGREDLIDIIIPDGVTSISSNAFAGCKNLESVVFPKTGKISIGKFAFNDTKIERITIPSNVVSIDGRAFGGSALKEVRFEGKVPPVLAWPFGNRDKDFLIFIPFDSKGIKNEAGQEYERIFGTATLWYLPKVYNLQSRPGQTASFHALFNTFYAESHKRNISSYEYQWEKFNPETGDWECMYTGNTNSYNITVHEDTYGTYRLKIIAKYGDGTLNQTIISDEFTLTEGDGTNSSGKFDYSGSTTGGNDDDEDKNHNTDIENPSQNDDDSSQGSDSANNSFGGNSFSWIQGNNNTAISYPEDSSLEKDDLSASRIITNKASSENEDDKDSSKNSSKKNNPTQGEASTLKSANRLIVIFILILCFIRLSMLIIKEKRKQRELR